MKNESGFIKKIYSGYGIIILIVISVLLLVFGTFWGNISKNQTDKAQSQYSSSRYNAADSTEYISTYTGLLEKRISDLCESVSGINKAVVLVTLESGSEYVYAQNTDSHESKDIKDITRDYLILQNGNEDTTVLVKEIFPKIRGIAVVCTSGDDPVVQKKIIDLLSAALGVASNRICVSG